PTVPAAAPTGVPTPAPITANVEAPVPMDAQAVALGTHGSGIADVNNKRYYIVTVGRGIGVFDNWLEIGQCRSFYINVSLVCVY
ncbi:hypothetical protein DXG01_002334, partial [Tephrocybe rancida]